MISAQQLIQQYSLQQHPGGGWYKENYKSKELIAAGALPARFGGDRFFSTAIYFLLEQNNFSAFHRIKSDECWHFYAGGPLSVYELEDNGTMKVIQLGSDISKGQLFQYVVPANRWFASRPMQGSEFSFVGCTVSPGFDFTDFEIADRSVLLELYPQHKTIIAELSR
ncbi:MAG: cupin domain-containing protein [Ferruginibacter sp.]